MPVYCIVCLYRLFELLQGYLSTDGFCKQVFFDSIDTCVIHMSIMLQDTYFIDVCILDLCITDM